MSCPHRSNSKDSSVQSERPAAWNNSSRIPRGTCCSRYHRMRMTLNKRDTSFLPHAKNIQFWEALKRLIGLDMVARQQRSIPLLGRSWSCSLCGVHERTTKGPQNRLTVSRLILLETWSFDILFATFPPENCTSA